VNSNTLQFLQVLFDRIVLSHYQHSSFISFDSASYYFYNFQQGIFSNVEEAIVQLLKYFPEEDFS